MVISVPQDFAVQAQRGCESSSTTQSSYAGWPVVSKISGTSVKHGDGSSMMSWCFCANMNMSEELPDVRGKFNLII